MKNILVVGSSGYLGFYLSRYLIEQPNYYNVKCTSRRSDLGIADYIGDAVEDVSFIESICSKVHIDVIINCVACADVDFCENNQEIAEKINFKFVKKLVTFCNNTHKKLVHFSTNAVYSGECPPYSESSVMNPLNTYGSFKKKADEYIASQSKNFLICRLMTLIGEKQSFHRNNPLWWTILSMIKSSELKLVTDNISNLLWINDAVKMIERLLKNNATGEYNLAGSDIISRYDLGLKVRQAIQKYEKMPLSQLSALATINPCSSDQFPSLVKRPMNTTFNITKVQKFLSMQPTPIDNVIKSVLSSEQLSKELIYHD